MNVLNKNFQNLAVLIVFKLHSLRINLNSTTDKFMKIKLKLVIKLKKNLVLTGMMGVGKSTIGKNLANKLYTHIDIDKIIEGKEGTTINFNF